MWWKRRVNMRTTTEIKPIANGAWEKWHCRFYATFLIFIHFRDSDIEFVWKEKETDDNEDQWKFSSVFFYEKKSIWMNPFEDNVFKQSISINAIDYLFRISSLIIRLLRSIASGIFSNTQETSTFFTLENVVGTIQLKVNSILKIKIASWNQYGFTSFMPQFLEEL